MGENKAWEYIKNKTLSELQGYACNINGLVDEVVESVLDPQELDYDRDRLHQLIRDIVISSSYFEQTLSDYKIARFSASDLEAVFQPLSPNMGYLCFAKHVSQALYKELKATPNFESLGIARDCFVLNRANAKDIFTLMQRCIDSDSTTLNPIHTVFEELRRELSETQHQFYFGIPKGAGGPFMLRQANMMDAFLDTLFDSKNSRHTPLSHKQIWKMSEKFTDDEREQLFGVTTLNREDHIDINALNWNDFFAIAKQYDTLCSLKNYQCHRIVSQFTYEQATQFAKIYLNKAARFSENTLQSGSQYLAAYGLEAGRILKILAILTQTAANCTVLLKNFVYMPILAGVGLFSAKMNYDVQVGVEGQRRKAIILSYTRTNTVRRKIAQEQQHLDAIRAELPTDESFQHDGHTCHYKILKDWVTRTGLAVPDNILQNETNFLAQNREQELLRLLTRYLLSNPVLLLPHPNLQRFVAEVREQVPTLRPAPQHARVYSPYSDRQSNTPRARTQLAWSRFKRGLSHGYTKIQPVVAPLLMGFFTAVSVFTFVFMFTAFMPYLAVAAGGALLLGALVGYFRYKSDVKERKIQTICNEAQTTYQHTLNERQNLHEHQRLCEIINGLIKGETLPPPQLTSTDGQSREEALASENAHLRELLKQQGVDVSQANLPFTLFAQPQITDGRGTTGHMPSTPSDQPKEFHI